MLSPLTMLWSMCASICFMLGLIHLLFWLKDKSQSKFLLSSLMAISAGISALLELGLLNTVSIDTYKLLLRYENLLVFMILVPMVWFVHLYLKTGRTWLAMTITLLWSISIIVNFLSPNSLTFAEIYELKRLTTFWNETYTLPVGKENSWKILADISSLLILVYVTDASVRSYKQVEHGKSWIIGGAIIVFILLAGIHTPLVDAGMIKTPYMISFFFLAIIIAFSYQLATDAIQTQAYARKIITSEKKRNAAERQLLHTCSELSHLSRQNLLGELSTTLAHEIYQPLSAIKNNSLAAQRYLLSQPPDLQEVKEILGDIHLDNERAVAIISHLRRLLHKGIIEKSPCAMNDIIQEVILFLNYEIKKRNVMLKSVLATDNPIVCVGKIEIQQVIINILLNAMQSMSGLAEKNRRLTITSKATNQNTLTLSITDTGKGIGESARNNIFDAFYSTKTDGLGMGLTISRRIIEAHGGKIWIAATSSAGTTLSFALPLHSST